MPDFFLGANMRQRDKVPLFRGLPQAQFLICLDTGEAALCKFCAMPHSSKKQSFGQLDLLVRSWHNRNDEGAKFEFLSLSVLEGQPR